MTPESGPYNPLDTENIGDSLIRAVIAKDPVRIDQMTEFAGAGVYALYYTGDFPAYKKIAEANAGGAFSQAIYVGKAIPSGGRKGDVPLGSVTGNYLFRRLSEHRESITAVSNLDVMDFHVRWLVVEPIWIPLTETLMINRSACVWNVLIDGFGNHNPGANRHSGRRTMWDTLHPGRWYAEKATPNPKWTAETLAQEAATWINQRI